MISIAPALPLFIGGIVLAFSHTSFLRSLNGSHITFVRLGTIIVAPLLAFILIVTLHGHSFEAWSFMGKTITPTQEPPHHTLIGSIFIFICGLGGIFALKSNNKWELPSAFFYGGSAVAVIMSGDWIMLLIFWEIMAIASTILIWCGNQKNSYTASLRYLYMHLFGGVCLMAGVVATVHTTGSTTLAPLALESIGSYLVLAGILVNVAAPPVSFWAVDAYPEASTTGTVFLSAFTTKTAVFVLWFVFPGLDILVWLGLYMAVYGAAYALLENDIRRILIYALINQVGFLVAAVGMNTEMTMNGAMSHAVAHILYKSLLLMTAGAVIHVTGKRLMTDLGGLYKSMPFVTTIAIIAMLTGAAFPLTIAFTTKSLISSGAGKAGLEWVWILLTLTGAGIYISSMLRFVYFTFFHHTTNKLPHKAVPIHMKSAMAIGAFACLYLGIDPYVIYENLPLETSYSPYKFAAIINQLMLLGFATLAFFTFKKYLAPQKIYILDWDCLYRIFIPKIMETYQTTTSRIRQQSLQNARVFLSDVTLFIQQITGTQSLLARTWGSGTIVLCVSLLLGFILMYVIVL